MSNIAEKTQGIGKVFGNITLPECATVTLDTVSNPKSITVDFGATPCLCDQWDGLYRQGIIKATWTGGFKDAGTVITTVTSNYYRGVSANEMDKYEINKTTTNMGLNQNNNPSFHVAGTVNITYFTGETANWNIDKIREWTQGVNTPDINDDVFLITGTVTGTNRNSIAVTSTTTTPLMRNSCNWFVSGVVEITRGNLPTMTVDFGNGNCDDQATVTVNGQTKTITLK